MFSKARFGATAPQLLILAVAYFIFVIGVVPQIVAVSVTAKLAGVTSPRLNVFQLMGLWFTKTPAAFSGVSGFDVAHWLIVVGIVLVFFAVAIFLLVLFIRRAKDPQNKRGLATSSEAAKELGERQLIKKRAPVLRPSLKNPAAKDVGFYVGDFHNAAMWLRAEDPTIVIGGSGSGKGVNFVLPWILSAPGCVITTSNKLDNLQLTLKQSLRAHRKVLIFAPGIPGGEDLGHVLRWDAVLGCVDEQVLVRRIKALVPDSAFGGSTSNGGHWDTLGQQLAAHLFHAAACAGGGVDMVWDWVSNSSRAIEAVEAIRNHPEGLLEQANHLESVLQQAPEQRAISWGVLPTVLSFLESRTARRWLSPTDEEREDLAQFVLEKGILYLVGDKGTSGGYLRIIDGLLAEIDFVTKGLADAMPGSRLDPPVTYILDEAGNFEYQGLPELITAGRGRGRVGIAVFQSRSQLGLWGEDMAGAIWDAAIAKIILPGGGDEKQLEAFSKLIGELWVERESVTHSGGGGSSLQVGEEKRAIFEASQIRTLADGYAILFYRRLKPVVVKLKPIYKYADYGRWVAESKEIAAVLQNSSPFAAQIKKFKSGRDA